MSSNAPPEANMRIRPLSIESASQALPGSRIDGSSSERGFEAAPIASQPLFSRCTNHLQGEWRPTSIDAVDTRGTAHMWRLILGLLVLALYPMPGRAELVTS